MAPSRGVAQLVARLVWDQEVAGSNPAAPTRGPRGRRVPRHYGLGGSTKDLVAENPAAPTIVARQTSEGREQKVSGSPFKKIYHFSDPCSLLSDLPL